MRFYGASPSTTVFDANGWHRSSFSGSNGGTCVEVNLVTPDVVGVRDSKIAVSPVLEFPPLSWQAFTDAVNRHTTA